MNESVFEQAKYIIIAKGGVCLTENCNNQYDKITIKCDKNHIWITTSKSIKMGRWCTFCHNLKRSELRMNPKNKFLEVKKFIESKNGLLLSTEYKGKFEKLLFQCNLGHQWETCWTNIVHGTWCHECAKAKAKLTRRSISIRNIPSTTKYTLEDVQKIAQDKGGQCLSDKYQQRMKFKCSFNHEWDATTGNIIGRNSWCPTCSSSMYERICKLYMETIFNEKFPKCYPKWLVNLEGNGLELDGYCEKLNLAFEHNGSQHYKQIKFRGRLYEFEKLQSNDKIKLQLCKDNGVKLIIIPELVSMLKIDKLKDFIREECVKLNVQLPENYESIFIDYKKIYLTSKDEERLDDLKNRLLKNNFELLSTQYLGSIAKYKVKCLICNNIKTTCYGNLLTHKCMSCLAQSKRHTIVDAQNLAKLKNGICLSDDYKNNHTKLLWKCEKEHTWLACYNQIQSGTWCPVCYSKRKLIKLQKNYINDF
jgi:hypothetical protein